jgi:rod shape-determining protein MreC
MFSKKMFAVALVVAVFIVNLALLTLTSRSKTEVNGVESIAIPVIAPFQRTVARAIRFTNSIWEDYFDLVNVAKENKALIKSLGKITEQLNQYHETELLNDRLKTYLSFRKEIKSHILAASVIAKDSSPWYRTILIDKGKKDGVKVGCPVVVPEGIAGQIVTVSGHFSKVLLIIDRNCAVDALVQRTRARGIVKGESSERCRFDYVLRKNDVATGDTVVSSGLDGVYPKGLRVGMVTEVLTGNSGIFQAVTMEPFVEFEKLEEVLIITETNEISEKK